MLSAKNLTLSTLVKVGPEVLVDVFDDLAERRRMPSLRSSRG
jgi:hypothetical protein